MLLISKGSFEAGTPPPVFWKKSVQTIENKGRDGEKDDKERSRARKDLEGKDIEELEKVRDFREGITAGRGKEPLSEYSQARIRRIGEIVNNKSKLWYLSIGHKLRTGTPILLAEPRAKN